MNCKLLFIIFVVVVLSSLNAPTRSVAEPEAFSEPSISLNLV